ncbi:MAG: M20/M25/M40 family metallo-hydrolase [Acidobacteria bacterium]|nr:M20/M25/M40 family metallo-hydrolase [Acidobacteriota bacterium]
MSAVADVAERIFQHLEGEDLAELALRLGNTYSPSGHERPMAEAVCAWLEERGVPARLQCILPDRANAVAGLRGTGGGKSLIFNSHIDTEASGPEYEWGMGEPDLNRVGGHRADNKLFGHTILNDRGLTAVAMVTLAALRESGLKLKGDLLFTAVAGETGSAPVDEYEGSTYEGKGFGTRFALDHGLRGDFALVAETTDYGIAWVECGAAYLKITVRGRNMYTPRSVRPAELAQHPNAIVKMSRIVQVLEDWARGYEAAQTFVSPCGRVVPKAVLGAVRGGIPYRPNRTSPLCSLYMDVRVPPGKNPDGIMEEIRNALKPLGLGAEVELFMFKPGHIGQGVEPLADAIRRAHRQIRGSDPPAEAPTPVISMWRDINLFNGVGIPAITFGPARRMDEASGKPYLALEDLVETARMYALIACDLCGVAG